MVATRCARVVPALLALSALLVRAQPSDHCGFDRKGKVTRDPRPLQPVDLPPHPGQTTCIDVLTVPDVCDGKAAGLEVTACDVRSAPTVVVADDLKSATIYRTDCSRTGRAFTTVYCPTNRRGLLWGDPPVSEE